MQRFNHHFRGFTLMEAVIALGIGSVLMVGFFFGFRKFSESQQRETLKEQIVSEQQAAMRMILEDIGAAAKFTGSSGKIFYPVSRRGLPSGWASSPDIVLYDDPYTSSDLYDPLTIYRDVFPELRIPVIGGAAYQSGTVFPNMYHLFYVIGGTGDYALRPEDEQTYFSALTTRRYWVLSNGPYRNLLPVEEATIAECTSANCDPTVPPPDTDYTISEVGYGTTLYTGSSLLKSTEYKGDGGWLSAAEKIEYKVIGTNLYRIVDESSTAANGSTTRNILVASNVARFHVKYDLNPPIGSDRIRPNAPVRKPGEGGDISTAPTFQDATKVYVSLSLSVPSALVGKIALSDTTEDSGFHTENGNVVYGSMIAVRPGSDLKTLMNQTAEASGSLTVGSTNCGDINLARCDPVCSFLFTDPDPLSQYWVAYGNSNSDICKCGRPNVAAPFIDPAIDPALETYAQNPTRLDACARHSNCGLADVPWLESKHPGCQLVRQCLTPDMPGQSTPNGAQRRAFNQTQGFNIGAINSMISTSGPDLMCLYQGGNCDSICANWAGSGVSCGADTWKNHCACKLRHEWTDGGTFAGTGPHLQAGAVNWDSICNQGAGNCGNTWNGAAWLLESAANPQGLTRSEATLCECRIADNTSIFDITEDVPLTAPSPLWNFNYANESRDFRWPVTRIVGEACPAGSPSYSCLSGTNQWLYTTQGGIDLDLVNGDGANYAAQNYCLNPGGSGSPKCGTSFPRTAPSVVMSDNGVLETQVNVSCPAAQLDLINAFWPNTVKTPGACNESSYSFGDKPTGFKLIFGMNIYLWPFRFFCSSQCGQGTDPTNRFNQERDYIRSLIILASGDTEATWCGQNGIGGAANRSTPGAALGGSN